MITYNFNKSANILETRIDGFISISEVNRYIISIREDKSLPARLKILSDASKAKFSEKVTKKDLVHLLNENKIVLSKKEFIYDAFIVSTAFETALGMLYKELNEFKNYRFNIFSTKEAAYEWLNSEMN